MKRLVQIGIFVLLVFTFLYSSIQIGFWFSDNQATDTMVSKVQSIVHITEVPDTSETVAIVEDAPSMMEVDFSSLMEINPEVSGWIRVPGTDIDYAFVKHQDNSYYLKHGLDGSYNTSGWVFLDYRNQIDDLGMNTILYAHGRVDGKMFGTLKNTLSSSWQEDSENHYVYISTPFHNYVFQVFSTYVINTTSDYLYDDFIRQEDRQSFFAMLLSRSTYDFGVNLDSYDKILTLSTCYNSYQKMVLHAKLVKSEKRF